MNGNGANRAVTLGDVAKRAQVSIATASKALNGREDFFFFKQKTAYEI